MNNPLKVRVVCPDPSHSPKVAFVGWLEFIDGGGGSAYLQGGNERLIANRPVDPRDLFGTVSRPPSRPNDLRRARSRYVMRCKLCRRDVPMRAETAGPVAHKLIQAGIKKISLAELDALLRAWQKSPLNGYRL